MSKPGALSVDNAWNSVALEERLELISRCQASGIMAGLGMVALMGSIAYGFDKIWILFGSLFACLLVMPLFTSYAWRRGKPELILKYLAIRSVARRYAFGVGIPELDIVLIFRGFMEEQYKNTEDEIMRKQQEGVDIESTVGKTKEVWVCLMRGAVVLMSERPGGAKLEFLTPITDDITATRANDPDFPAGTLFITGTGPSRGRRIKFWSNYPGALYVFEKQLVKLISEADSGRDW